MKAQDAIREASELSTMVLKSYVSDLDDADLMQRPGAGCNHLAWQLGHLISSECNLLEAVAPGASIKLPEGFAEKHSNDTTGIDDPAKFCKKQEYLDLLDKVHAASLAALAKTSEADLDAASPEHFQDKFPTVGTIYLLIATHALMHAGQFVPVRRKLDKAIVI